MKTPVIAVILIGLTVYSSAPAVEQSKPVLRTDQLRVVYAQPIEARHQAIHDALQERRIWRN